MEKPDTEVDTGFEVDSSFEVDTLKEVANKNAVVDSTGGLDRETPSETPTGPPPAAPVAGRANLPQGWLPLEAMIQAVLEETGQKVFFPKRYHSDLKRLMAKYGANELVNAVRESCSQSFGPTFKWRLFAARVLHRKYGPGGMLATILAARELRMGELAASATVSGVESRAYPAWSNRNEKENRHAD